MFGLGDLFERHGTVDELEFNDGFVEHLRVRATFDKHRVSLVEILQAHQGNPRYFLNDGQPTDATQHRAPLVMLGATDAGRVIKVPLISTDSYGVWRPITAFQANTHDVKRYEEGLNNG